MLGQRKFDRFMTFFGPVALLALVYTVIVLFGLQGRQVRIWLAVLAAGAAGQQQSFVNSVVLCTLLGWGCCMVSLHCTCDFAQCELFCLGVLCDCKAGSFDAGS